MVRILNFRYKRTTLFIISHKTEEIYQEIKEITHHGATLFHGVGLYNGEERTMLYSVISSDQVKEITKQIHKIDPQAFINVIRTDQISGKFYQKPND